MLDACMCVHETEKRGKNGARRQKKSPNEEQKINYNERKIPHLDPMVYLANHLARCATRHTQIQTRIQNAEK